VELVAIEGTLSAGVDLLDGAGAGSKPYVPTPMPSPARAGWIDGVDEATGHRSAPGPKKPRRV
jgi:hypothetical protein